MLWMQIFSGHDPVLAFGALRMAFQAIISAKVVCVPMLFHWHGVLAQWSGLNRQHDTSEFLTFVLTKAEPVGYLLEWQAKRQHREVFQMRTVVTDAGHGFHPLVIDICSGGLQQCIDSWSTVSSSSIHALRFAPRFLLLQLRRYTQHRGAILKSGVPVHIAAGELIWMPIWDDGFDLRYEQYQVTTAIFHLGATVHSGHYRAALSYSTRDGPLQWCLTDDGILPARAREADLKILRENVYIIGLCRSEPDLN